MIARISMGLLSLSLALALTASPARAQAPAAPATPATLPAGHPPVAPAGAPAARPAPLAARAAPTSPPPARSAAQPPTPSSSGSSAAPASPHAVPANPHAVPANPHAAAPGAPALPQDENLPASDLPKGSVEAFVLNGERAPQSGVDVRLSILFSRISEGENRTERVARTDAEGRVRFDGLTAASDYSYRILVASGPAEYSSSPFNLHERVGQRVRLHVFPVTRDIRAAMVGMRGFVYIEPRDDVFVFEVLYRIFNIGTVTWVPENVVVRLPEAFKAFSAQKGMTDVVFEVVDGEGARLKGTFPPGQQDVSFRFQVPTSGDSNTGFRIGALPRTAELRVIAEASSKMRLSVEGFEEPQVSSNQQGKRVLVTRRLLKSGDELDAGVNISLDGLPVPSSGRWIAVAISALLAAIGLASARGYMRLDPSDKLQDQDLQSARELLLHELVDVERARSEGQLGPRAHAEARRTLLDALARLGRDVLAPPAPRKKRRRAAA